MYGTALITALLLTAGLYLRVAPQDNSPATSVHAAPLYHVSFERGDVVAGVSSTRAIQLPLQCTSDGSIFVNFVGLVPANSGIQPPLFSPSQLVSISPTGRSQTFTVEQVPDLYISREVDYFASDSEVIFLTEASRENIPAKQTVLWKDGSKVSKREFPDNAAEKHYYIVTFSRDGEYKRTAKLDDAFSIHKVGVFPSGTFLVFGFDNSDHSAKLAMLKEDGTLLKTLEIPTGGTPKSMVSGRDATQPLEIAPSEFVSSARSIVIVQNKTTFPLLEINEGGAVRAIGADLPKGQRVEAVISSDQNLYVIASPIAAKEPSGMIYEINSDDGSILRRFELPHGRWGSDVACVHGGKFLSIDYADGKVVPLIGSAEPATVDQRKP